MAVLGGQDIIFDNRLSITAHMNSFAIGDIIKNKYQIVEKINEGAFGEVYKLKIIDAPVQNEDEKEEILENFLAVKIESGSIFPSQIAIEAKIYKDMQGIQGFANKILAGTWRGYRLLIMDRLGPSIEEIFISSKRMFSLRTVLELGIQMIQRVKDLHEKGWIHRDLKPQNFVVGLGKLSKTIFLIDFGLARRYEINQGKECVSVKKNNFAGTLRYWSVNTHMGIEQSRRDDLEAIGYIIIYLLKGFLPWQGQRGPNSRIRRQMIGDLKRKITMSELCKYLPNEIMGFLTYVRSLSLHQNPDYSYCIKLLRQAFINSGFLKSDSWEWNDKGEIIMMDEDESGQQRLLPQMLDKQNAEELKRDREIWRAAKKLRMLDDQVKIKAFLSQDPTNRGSKFRMRLERIQQGLKELEEEEKEENRRWIQMLTLNSIAESNKMQQRINISGIKLNLKNPQLSKLRPSSVNAVYGLDLAGQSRQKWSNFGPSNPGVMYSIGQQMFTNQQAQQFSITNSNTQPGLRIQSGRIEDEKQLQQFAIQDNQIGQQKRRPISTTTQQTFLTTKTQLTSFQIEILKQKQQQKDTLLKQMQNKEDSDLSEDEGEENQVVSGMSSMETNVARGRREIDSQIYMDLNAQQNPQINSIFSNLTLPPPIAPPPQINIKLTSDEQRIDINQPTLQNENIVKIAPKPPKSRIFSPLKLIVKEQIVQQNSTMNEQVNNNSWQLKNDEDLESSKLNTNDENIKSSKLNTNDEKRNINNQDEQIPITVNTPDKPIQSIQLEQNIPTIPQIQPIPSIQIIQSEQTIQQLQQNETIPHQSLQTQNIVKSQRSSSDDKIQDIKRKKKVKEKIEKENNNKNNEKKKMLKSREMEDDHDPHSLEGLIRQQILLLRQQRQQLKEQNQQKNISQLNQDVKNNNNEQNNVVPDQQKQKPDVKIEQKIDITQQKAIIDQQKLLSQDTTKQSLEDEQERLIQNYRISGNWILINLKQRQNFQQFQQPLDKIKLMNFKNPIQNNEFKIQQESKSPKKQYSNSNQILNSVDQQKSNLTINPPYNTSPELATRSLSPSQIHRNTNSPSVSSSLTSSKNSISKLPIPIPPPPLLIQTTNNLSLIQSYSLPLNQSNNQSLNQSNYTQSLNQSNQIQSIIRKPFQIPPLPPPSLPNYPISQRVKRSVSPSQQNYKSNNKLYRSQSPSIPVKQHNLLNKSPFQKSPKNYYDKSPQADSKVKIQTNVDLNKLSPTLIFEQQSQSSPNNRKSQALLYPILIQSNKTLKSNQQQTAFHNHKASIQSSPLSSSYSSSPSSSSLLNSYTSKTQQQLSNKNNINLKPKIFHYHQRSNSLKNDITQQQILFQSVNNKLEIAKKDSKKVIQDDFLFISIKYNDKELQTKFQGNKSKKGQQSSQVDDDLDNPPPPYKSTKQFDKEQHSEIQSLVLKENTKKITSVNNNQKDKIMNNTKLIARDSQFWNEPLSVQPHIYTNALKDPQQPEQSTSQTIKDIQLGVFPKNLSRLNTSLFSMNLKQFTIGGSPESADMSIEDIIDPNSKSTDTQQLLEQKTSQLNIHQQKDGEQKENNKDRNDTNQNKNKISHQYHEQKDNKSNISLRSSKHQRKTHLNKQSQSQVHRHKSKDSEKNNNQRSHNTTLNPSSSKTDRNSADRNKTKSAKDTNNDNINDFKEDDTQSSKSRSQITDDSSISDGDNSSNQKCLSDFEGRGNSKLLKNLKKKISQSNKSNKDAKSKFFKDKKSSISVDITNTQTQSNMSDE